MAWVSIYWLYKFVFVQFFKYLIATLICFFWFIHNKTSDFLLNDIFFYLTTFLLYVCIYTYTHILHVYIYTHTDIFQTNVKVHKYYFVCSQDSPIQYSPINLGSIFKISLYLKTETVFDLYTEFQMYFCQNAWLFYCSNIA